MFRVRARFFVQFVMLGLLLAGLAIKPALAASEELHDLVAHAALSDGGGTHETPDEADAPDEGAPGGEHDDGHIHLTHCCGHQAAVPARVQVPAHAPRNASPLERARIAFAPAPRTAPFRPPIAA